MIELDCINYLNGINFNFPVTYNKEGFPMSRSLYWWVMETTGVSRWCPVLTRFPFEGLI